MRIVVDLQSAQSGSRLGGIGRYSMDLFGAMVQVGSDHEFIVLLNSRFPQTENEIRSALRNTVPATNIVTFPAPRGCASARQIPELTRSAELIRENFIASLNPDVVHVSSLIEGLHEDVVTSIGASGQNPPTAATLYDFIPMREREAYLASSLARGHYFSKIRSLAKADALLAISQFVTDEVKEFLPNFSGPAVNIRGGIGSQFQKIPLGPHVAALRQKYSLDRNIILYTASFDQRKNQTGLIEAFSLIPEEKRRNYQLAFAGGGDSGVYSRLLGFAASKGLKPGEVNFLGRVSDEDLVQLYNVCTLFVFPPMSEGMGMPPLEAMSCGAPVIGSNTSSIPEVIGWEEALFNPADAEQIAEKIERGLFDQDFRRENIERGSKHLETYQWKYSAAAALEVLGTISRARPERILPVDCVTLLATAAHGEALVESDAEKVAKCAVEIDAAAKAPWRTNRAKMGWVTSWGGRCGIASYSKHLIDHFPAPTVILASYKSSEETKPDANVIRCWEEGKEDYLVELLAAIDVNEIEILHIQFNYGFFEFSALRDLILSCVAKGISVFVTLHSTLDQADEPSYQLSHLLPALQVCTRLYVHSKHDIPRLAALGLTANVTVIPLGTHSSRRADRESKRVGDEQLIATYGFALPGKGLVEIVEAVSIIRQSDENFRLKMVNAHYADSHGVSESIIKAVKEKIEALDLADAVELITDYLTDDESLAHLAAADLVVFPYTKTGESGSAAVRAGLIAGRLVATTPLPIFDDIKEVVYQLPGQTPKELAVGITEVFRKMKSGDPTLDQINAAASRLTSVTAYPNVARFLDESMRSGAYFDVYRPAFASTKQNVSLRNGRWVDNSIVADTVGLVCYGPYARLSRGVNRLIIRGTLEPSNGHAVAYVGTPTRRLHSFKLSSGRDGRLCDSLFVVADDLTNVEVSVELGGDATLRLDGYSVSGKWR